MFIPASAAMWFLPFVLPICVYVAFTDMREMRIKNHAVITLFLVYVFVGLIAIPPWSTGPIAGYLGPFEVALPIYVWQLLHVVIVLVTGIILNAAGALGAGDAKFMAAASAFVWLGDLVFVFVILAASTLGAVITHRIAKNSRLRLIAPHWESWDRGKEFPMGLALGCALSMYLILGTVHGS